MSTQLPIVEKFHSLQGEGAHVGRSAFFIRLAHCEVGCPWCDTKNSWSPTAYPKVSVLELANDVAIAQSKGAAFVVITGGEPLHHNLHPICNAIKKLTSKQGKSTMPIHLETSGVNHLSGSPNWITLSPKKHAKPQEKLLATCNELKVIIHNADDLLFAESIAKKATALRKNPLPLSDTHNEEVTPLLFLQPGWDSKEGYRVTIEYIKKNPAWRLSLQTHKWLGVL